MTYLNNYKPFWNEMINDLPFSYFSFGEFIHSCDSSRVNVNITNNIFRLINVLDPIRHLLGSPITINSGFRNSVVNEKVGGSSTSQHLNGSACDISTVSVDKLFVLLCLICSFPYSFGQVIYYPLRSFIHVSLPSNKYPNLQLYVADQKGSIKKVNNLFN